MNGIIITYHTMTVLSITLTFLAMVANDECDLSQVIVLITFKIILA